MIVSSLFSCHLRKFLHSTCFLPNRFGKYLCIRSYNIMSVHAALIDLSGTLHVEDEATPNAQFSLERLRNAGIKVKFVTNTTKESMRLLHERLVNLGFQIDQNEIFSSLTAAKCLIEARGIKPLLLLEECAKEDFKGYSEEDPNAVVVGLSPSFFDYSHMNQAFRLLLNGAPLIAIHKARYYKKSDGLYLGPGPFVSCLEYAADVKAEVVGKPEKTFFNEAVKDLNVDVKHTVMIGDDVRDDIYGALNAGMMGILVKTGKYRAGDEAKIEPEPTAVCDNFTKAVDFILK